jgi:hypothetical protein
MALLDLQSMEEPEESKGVAAKSASSKDCASHISLLLC